MEYDDDAIAALGTDRKSPPYRRHSYLNIMSWMITAEVKRVNALGWVGVIKWIDEHPEQMEDIT